jgi:murein DD-endopeptidase MepM/ murein hydrolase activator NlpD
MRDKRIKLIYFSLRGSGIRYFELSWKKMFFVFSVFMVFLLIFVGSIIGLFTNYYHNYKIKSLNRMNMGLMNQLEVMQANVNEVQSKMEQLEENDDQERMIAGLDKIDKDMRGVGVGGAAFNYSTELSDFSKQTREDITNTGSIIDQLERRILLLVESKNEIDQKILKDKQKLKHTPSIRPVMGGRITDPFGMRLDPFIERIKMHKGIDIAAQVGTPVYATASGVVSYVQHSYRHNQGYGKEVIINHDNGIKTRYAHLSKISVRVGQKVNRWDTIGTVGNTGRATGPHLHYEVIVNTNQVDPVTYILE